MRLSLGSGRCIAALLLSLLLLPLQGHALGFGALNLQSHLHMTLKADIPLLLDDSDDMKQVHISLANAQEYRQLGLRWQSDLSALRVLIYAKSSAQPILQLRSSGLIHAPMLSVLLKAKKTGRGTYFKHYQLLLDPIDKPKPVGSKLTLGQTLGQGVGVTLGESSKAAMPVVRLQAEGNDAVAENIQKNNVVWARTWRYGPVQAGDSLSEIAYRLRLDKRFSNKQVMLGMYEHNPAAFVDGNINHLIKGAWLTVPRAEVVRKLAGEAAMQKLSKLLSRANPNVKLDRGNRAETPEPVAEKAPSLRYSGNISLHASDTAMVMLRTGIDQRFEAVHQKMMAGALKMTSLDETVTALNVSMQHVKHDILRLQQDIETLKSQRETSPVVWSNMAFLGLIALLLVLIVLVVMMVFKRRQQPFNEQAEKTNQDEGVVHADQPVPLQPEQPSAGDFDAMQADMNQIDLNKIDLNKIDLNQIEGNKTIEVSLDAEQNNIAPAASGTEEAPETQLQALVQMSSDTSALSMDEEFTPLADEVVQLLNQTEASLGQCEFEQAEATLKHIEDKWPDSLKALALKAQLYHETDRLDERNDLINSISEASNEQRWERFCYFLPSHVWNACFGGSISNHD